LCERYTKGFGTVERDEIDASNLSSIKVVEYKPPKIDWQFIRMFILWNKNSHGGRILGKL